jgi:hypothetical protein
LLADGAGKIIISSVKGFLWDAVDEKLVIGYNCAGAAARGSACKRNSQANECWSMWIPS